MAGLLKSPERFPFLLFKLRGFYLATGLAGGLLNPYMSTIFKDGGLSDAHVGVVMACSSVLIIAAQLFWGRLADKYGMTKPILLISLAVPAVAALLYQAPSLPVIIAAYMAAVAFTAPQAPIGDAYAVPAALLTARSAAFRASAMRWAAMPPACSYRLLLRNSSACPFLYCAASALRPLRLCRSKPRANLASGRLRKGSRSF